MCIFILLRKTRILWLVFLFLFLFCTGDTSLTTTDKAPQTPANITAKGLDSKIILRWDSAATATSYTIYWSTDTADPTKLSKIQGIGATAYTHSPLVNGVAYYYRVSAVNSAGESPLSAVVKAIPTTEVSVPLPPDNVMAKKGDKKNTLFWDSSAQAISYNLYWSFNSPVTKSDSAIKEITSPFEHMNLTNGKSYYYRLSALNAVGESGLSSEVTAKPAEILIPPLPPQGVKAFPQNAAVTLTWLPDTAASAYTLYWSKTTPVTKSDSMNSGLKSPYLHGNRINGTTYYYRITSSNSAGESGLSQEVSVVPDSTTGLPEIPKNLKVLAGDKKVTLTWDVVKSAWYYVYWDTIAAITKLSNKTKNITVNTYVHSNLTNGRTYYYRAVAANTAGESDLSSQAYATPNNSTDPPAPPANVKALSGDKKITLSWNASANTAAYTVYWATTAQVTNQSNKIVTITDTLYEHVNLTNGQAYYYKVSASNTAGESSLSIEVNAVPAPANDIPKPPENLRVVPGNKKNVLLWNPVSNASHYSVYWDYISPVTKKSNKEEKAFCPFEMINLINGKKYYYRVTAVNSAGESQLSDENSATPQMLYPPFPIVIDQGDKELYIDWDSDTGVGINIYWANSPGVTKDSNRITCTTAPYLFTNCTNEKVYYFRLSTYNIADESALSPEYQATPHALLPPDSITIKAGANYTYLQWNAKITAETFNLYWSTFPGVNTTSKVIKNIDSTRFNHKFLTPGNVYYYRISSNNFSGESELSKEVHDTVGLKFPANFRATPGFQQVLLQWSSVFDATAYAIYYDTKPGITTSSPKLSISFPGYTHTGLTNGTTYYYRAASVNSSSMSQLSEELAAKPADDLIKPRPPENIKLVNGRSKIRISWDTVFNAASYTLYYDTTGNVTSGSYTIPNVQPPFLHTGLVNSATYSYKVSAVNKTGESPLSALVAVKANLDPPAAINASVQPKQITLAWPNSEGAATYRLYFASQAGVTVNATMIDNVNSPYIHSNLQDGITNYYRFCAINALDTSDLSIEISATTPLPIPKNLRATPFLDNITLQWDAILGAVSYTLYYDTIPGITSTSGKSIKNITPPYAFADPAINTPYYFRVSAVYALGESDLSDEIGTLVKILPPVNLSASAGLKKIRLTWDKINDLASYTLYWDTIPSVTKSSNKIEKITPPYSHTNLTPGTYYYRIASAYKTAESDLSNEIGKQIVDYIPTNVAIQASLNATVILWLGYPEIPSYTVYWDTKPNVTTNANKIEKVTAPFTHRSLAPDIPYYYRIASADQSDESGLSDEVHATPVSMNNPVKCMWLGLSGHDGNLDSTEICFWDGIAVKQLTDNHYANEHVRMSGKNSVWSGRKSQSDDFEIFFCDGNSVIQLTDNNYDDVNPEISGNNIVWQGKRDNGKYDLYFWDGNSIRKLTDNVFGAEYPHISGGNVVWSEYAGDPSEIFFWNGNTTIQLTNNTNKDIFPVVSGNNAAWQRHDGNDFEISFWNGVSVVQVTNNSYHDDHVDISGNNVTWRGEIGNLDYAIFLWNGNSIMQFANPDYRFSYPTISGNNIAWNGDKKNGGDINSYEIFFWDGTSVKQLTNNQYMDWIPVISGTTVAWSGIWNKEQIFYWDGTSVIQITNDENRRNFQPALPK